jgi:hypothetical protein
MALGRHAGWGTPGHRGALVAGRYRLRECQSEWAGVLVWSAVDEALGRPVTVWTFPPGFGRTRAVIAAARAALPPE